MTITRVIRDGVEFFTIDETGESGMSESGLARLCGVSTPAIVQILRNLPSTSDHQKTLEDDRSKGIRFKLHKNQITSRGQNADIVLVRAIACAKVIEYYAFDSKRKTEEALFAYRKFATIGINAWIQEMTEWHGNPTPRNGIVIDFTSLDTLLTTKFDASALRLYLYFQKAIRNRHTPTIEETLKATNISRSTYNTATAKLEPYQLLPEWSKVQRRNQPERAVRDRLQTQLGGQTEAPTPWGPVDLLTASEIIEVKALHLWKEAFGHLILKSKFFPNHTKRLHLYAPNDLNLKKVIEECQEFNIKVTFEETPKEKQKPRTKNRNLSTAQPKTAINLTPT
jgi:hypothetical protein